jgi:hypothetical protein
LWLGTGLVKLGLGVCRVEGTWGKGLETRLRVPRDFEHGEWLGEGDPRDDAEASGEDDGDKEKTEDGGEDESDDEGEELRSEGRLGTGGSLRGITLRPSVCSSSWFLLSM